MGSISWHNISLTKKHSIAPMEILYITTKGIMMNTLERFHTYNVKRLDNQVNDKCAVKYNAIFDTLIHKNS